MPQWGGPIRIPEPGEKRSRPKGRPVCPECGTLLRREGKRWWCSECEEMVKPK